jgi:hypothetical protein
VNRIIRVLGILAFVAIFLGAASVVHAAIIAYNVPAGTVGNQTFGGSLGMDFDVNNPIVISAIGVFDSGQDGLSLPITAQLYNRATQTLVPGAELLFSGVNPGTLIGGSWFQPLATPLHLPAGFQGTIVASGYGIGEPNGNQGAGALPGLTTNSGGGALSFVGTSRFGGANMFPTTIDGGPANRYAAGTFEYAPVPEPGTLLLIGSGLVGIGVGSRRRNRK